MVESKGLPYCCVSPSLLSGWWLDGRGPLALHRWRWFLVFCKFSLGVKPEARCSLSSSVEWVPSVC